MDPTMVVGRSTLYVSDVVEFLSCYDGRPFDVTVSSPPYNLSKEYEGVSDAWEWDDYIGWVEYWGKSLLDCTSDHGRLCLNVPFDTFRNGHIMLAAEYNTAMQLAGWEYQSTVIWNKGVINNRTAYGSFMSASAPNVMMPAEAILVYSKGAWRRGKNGRTDDITKEQFMQWRSTIWDIPGESAKRRGHPAPFPEAIPERLIKLYSFQEDLIFDPFLGSGTTCAVAEELGRESVGVDCVQSYVEDLAVPRIQAATDFREGALTDGQGERWVNIPLTDAVELAS